MSVVLYYQLQRRLSAESEDYTDDGEEGPITVERTDSIRGNVLLKIKSMESKLASIDDSDIQLWLNDVKLKRHIVSDIEKFSQYPLLIRPTTLVGLPNGPPTVSFDIPDAKKLVKLLLPNSGDPARIYLLNCLENGTLRPKSVQGQTAEGLLDMHKRHNTTNGPPTVSFELPTIASIEEAGTILPTEKLGVLIPMGSKIEHFNGSVTSNAVDINRIHCLLNIFLLNITIEGENGTISRNDGILVALAKLVGCDKCIRDKPHFTTPDDICPDFSGLSSLVTLIFAEEKEKSIAGSIRDILSKFRFVYNYNETIKFMYAFAILPNEFRIFKICRDPGSDIPKSCTLWFSSTLDSEARRMNCIVASLIVGKVLKYYRVNGLLEAAAMPRGVWIKRFNGKEIKLCHEYFVVRVGGDADRIRALKTFYLDTKEVPNLEKLSINSNYSSGFVDIAKNKMKFVEFCLKPIGRTRLPSTFLELKAAVRCLLLCLRSLHQLGYLHTDIRWPNIVQYMTSWVLIDCYDFCSMHDVDCRRERMRVRSHNTAPENAEWSPCHDLGQLLLLLDDAELQDASYTQFGLLRTEYDNVLAGRTTLEDLLVMVECLQE